MLVETNSAINRQIKEIKLSTTFLRFVRFFDNKVEHLVKYKFYSASLVGVYDVDCYLEIHENRTRYTT